MKKGVFLHSVQNFDKIQDRTFHKIAGMQDDSLQKMFASNDLTSENAYLIDKKCLGKGN